MASALLLVWSWVGAVGFAALSTHCQLQGSGGVLEQKVPAFLHTPDALDEVQVPAPAQTR